MADTYTTSKICARAAGMKTLSATTFPSTADVDDWRLEAYSAIGEIAGYGTPDVNGVGHRIEKNKVKKAIKQTRKAALDPEASADFDMALTPDEETSVSKAFSSTMGFAMFIPGANQ